MLDNEKNRISFVVCGGFNVSRTLSFTTSILGEDPSKTVELEPLPIEDDFIQQHAFHVTEDFVRKNVKHSNDLIAIQGVNKLHIFDKTHRLWLT